MKISLDVNKEDIEKLLLEYKGKVDYLTIQNLFYIGEECINIARNLGEEYKGKKAEELEELRHKPHQPNYIDDTGNLRNSIGYLVAVDGQIINANFLSQNGESFARSILTKHNHGYCLIMVAGMEYAVELEFERGYHVISPAVKEAKTKFAAFVEKLKNGFK